MRFDPFLEALRQQMQPAIRVEHVIGMWQHLLPLVPGDVMLADLVAGWQVLARPHHDQESAAIAHRRMVCAELATIAAQVDNKAGNLASAAKAWHIWRDTCQGSTDSRQASMAKTFARELEELQTEA